MSAKYGDCSSRRTVSPGFRLVLLSRIGGSISSLSNGRTQAQRGIRLLCSVVRQKTSQTSSKKALSNKSWCLVDKRPALMSTTASSAPAWMWWQIMWDSYTGHHNSSLAVSNNSSRPHLQRGISRHQLSGKWVKARTCGAEGNNSKPGQLRFDMNPRPCEISRYNNTVCTSGEHGEYILVGGKGLTKYAIYVCEQCAHGRVKNEAPSI